MKKILKATLLLTNIIAVTSGLFLNSISKASAEETYTIGDAKTGVKITYNSDAKKSTDYVFIKHQTEVKNAPNPIFHTYVALGFDSDEISSIEKMGFFVTYVKEKNFLHELGNGFNNLFGIEKRFGEVVKEDVLVSTDTIYTFEQYRQTSTTSAVAWVPEYKVGINKEELKFRAVGKVSDLLTAEDKARSFLNNPWLVITGGKNYNANKNTRINDSSLTFSKRKFYAILPFNLPEKAQPESFNLYLVSGDKIEGIPNNGAPIQAPGGGQNDYIISANVAKDFGIAINGKDAKVSKIVVSGFTSDNKGILMIENGEWNYDEQKVINITNKRIMMNDGTFQTNWSIYENNRYIFIKYDGDAEKMENVTITVHYTNSNAKASWLINVKGEKGFLPPAYEISPVSSDSIIPDWVIIALVAITVLILLWIISKVVDFIRFFLPRSRG